MKRRVRLSLSWLAVILIVSLAIFWLRSVPEPEYEGQRLNYWIAELEATYRSPNKARSERAERAMKSMGSQVLPRLISMLEARDTKINSWIYDQTQKRAFLTGKFHRADQTRWKACQALKAMGPAAGPAAPRLVALLLADSFDSWPAGDALVAIGRPAAIPLAFALTNGNGAASSLPFDILGQMGDEAFDAAPALIALLDRTNQFHRALAVRVLGAIGHPKVELLPRLTGMLQRGDLPFDVAPALCVLSSNGPAVLVRALTNEQSNVRLAALTAMEIGFGERRREKLRRAWKDRKQAWNLVGISTGRTNEFAAHLTKAGESNVLAQVLVTILFEGEAEEREAAAELLKHFKSEAQSVLPMLDRILNQDLQNADVKAAARRASEELRR